MASIAETEERTKARATGTRTVKAKGPLIYRQSIWTRITHWLWVICLFFLFSTGLNIFNAHPTLYFGAQSGFPELQSDGQHLDNAWLQIGAVDGASGPHGAVALFGHMFDSSALGLGMSGDASNPTFVAFPGWLTIPSYYDLGTARVVHFFFAWLLVATLLVWLVASIVNRHIAGIPPLGADWRRLPADILDHLRFRFAHRREYNVLQKIAYSVVLFILFPLIVLTGLTMSPGMDSVAPWLVELFGGRQTARSIHFLTMSAFVLFVVVHVVMVVLAGPINEMRQMITGRYRAGTDVPFDPRQGDKP